MSQIVVERGEGSFADRFRPYKVMIDGQYRGTIRQNETWAFAVSPGTHTVSFRIDYYHSPAVRVAVVNRTRLVCRSSVAHALGLLAIFSPGEWITVREEDTEEVAEAPVADDTALVREPPAPRGFFRKRLAARRAKNNVTEPAYRLAGPKTDEATQARRMLELDLREAVAARSFDVQYEPQIDLRSQKIVGFEVLVRWRHPVRGLVPPSVFVPLAEQIGLMGAIGQTVLEQACAEAATWPEEIGLSINLSQRQLADAACPAIFAAALQHTGVRPSRLELEVDEAVVMEHDAAVAASFQALRQNGVRIAIDNFGHAFANHSYVPEAIFDKVKISRSLIRPRGETEDSGSVIRAAAGLSASLGMVCCAVGVETAEQLSTLVAEGCTQAQGRVFGPPLTAREIPAVLARRLPRRRRRPPHRAPCRSSRWWSRPTTPSSSPRRNSMRQALSSFMSIRPLPA
jgi:EAL domain-containing protein (putative c-di-GMP-specific phosphodiesterase class I)